MKLFTPKRETVLHRVNPALKLVLFLGVLCCVLFTRSVDFVFFLTIASALLIPACGYAAKQILLFTAPFALVFFSSAFTLILFGKGEIVWWQWGLIKISEESFYHGVLIGFKTLCFGLLGIVFAITTKPVLFFYAMMQQLRLPAKYAYSFIASIGLFPMVWDDYRHRRDALRVRGVRYRKGIAGYYDRLRVYAVPLLAQSIRRAGRVAAAMEAKRFQMNAARTYYYRTGFAWLDFRFALLTIGMLAACAWLPAYAPIFGR